VTSVHHQLAALVGPIKLLKCARPWSWPAAQTRQARGVSVCWPPTTSTCSEAALLADTPAGAAGIWNCGKQIVEQEGVRSLWKGLTPFAVHLTLKYALRMGTNAFYQSLLRDKVRRRRTQPATWLPCRHAVLV
jgi:hypothetical protein